MKNIFRIIFVLSFIFALIIFKANEVINVPSFVIILSLSLSLSYSKYKSDLGKLIFLKVLKKYVLLSSILLFLVYVLSVFKTITIDNIFSFEGLFKGLAISIVPLIHGLLIFLVIDSFENITNKNS